MYSTATDAASVGVKVPDRMPPSRMTGVRIGPTVPMDARMNRCRLNGTAANSGRRLVQRKM
jgi:hypothetical protein